MKISKDVNNNAAVFFHGYVTEIESQYSALQTTCTHVQWHYWERQKEYEDIVV